MKAKKIAIVSLSAFTIFAIAQTSTVVNLPGTTTTTTTVTTTPDGYTTRETKTTTVTSNAADYYDIINDDTSYIYVEYDGVRVPYCRGYYYIDGVWVWRGPGRATRPAPRFRPVQTHRLPQTAQAAARSRYYASNRSSAARASHARTSSSLKRTRTKSAVRHSGGRAAAPRGPR